jgi:hypothetical protein
MWCEIVEHLVHDNSNPNVTLSGAPSTPQSRCRLDVSQSAFGLAGRKRLHVVRDERIAANYVET